MGLGMSGAYGAAEAQNALRRIRQDELDREQAQIANTLALRRIVEAELSGAHERGRGDKADVRADRAENRADTVLNQIQLPEAVRAAETHGLTMDTGRQKLRRGDLELNTLEGLTPIQKQQSFSGLSFEDLASPEAIIERGRTAGQATGAGVKSAFDSGGRDVEAAVNGPNGLRTLADLRKITASGEQDLRRAREVASLRGAASGGPDVQAEYQAERTARTLSSVDDLINQVGMSNTGLGSLTAMIPGTSSRDFQAKVNTLKSNIAFGELTAMRAASKTGGALGAVSERELTLLESALGALDTGQSPEQFKQQLQKIKDSLTRWEAARGGGQTPETGGGGQSAAFVQTAPPDQTGNWRWDGKAWVKR